MDSARCCPHEERAKGASTDSQAEHAQGSPTHFLTRRQHDDGGLHSTKPGGAQPKQEQYWQREDRHHLDVWKEEDVHHHRDIERGFNGFVPTYEAKALEQITPHTLLATLW